MKIYKIMITGYQLDYLIEAVKELIDKTKADGNMLIKAEEIQYNDFKIQGLEMLLNYLKVQ